MHFLSHKYLSGAQVPKLSKRNGTNQRPVLRSRDLSPPIRGQYYLLREHGAVPGAEAAAHGVTHDDGLLPAQVVQHTPANQTNQRSVMRSLDQFRPIRDQ